MRHLPSSCRNNWHIHHADKGGGQILICTAGIGKKQIIKENDSINSL